MEISLEHIVSSATPNTFRVAFHSATERCLLPYPKVTGLTFTSASGDVAAEWKTRVLVSEPLDDFVLTPGARIAFDLYANINADSEAHRWVIDLPQDKYNVHFVYHVDRETDWYDFLAKRSRLAAMTPIWRGKVQSNTIEFRVMDAQSENAHSQSVNDGPAGDRLPWRHTSICSRETGNLPPVLRTGVITQKQRSIRTSASESAHHSGDPRAAT